MLTSKNNKLMQFSPTLYILGLVWIGPVLLFLLNASEVTLFRVVTAASICSFLLATFSPKNFLVALPFLTYLSPVAGLFNVFGLQVVFTDLFFIVGGLHVIYFEISSNRQHHSGGHGLLQLIVFVYLLSLLLGLITGSLITSKPLIYLIQLIIIYKYTLRYCGTISTSLPVINAWSVATIFGSILLIYAFLTRIPLDNMKDADGRFASILLIDDISLFRATYFYSGFHFSLGMTAIFFYLKYLYEAGTKSRYYSLSCVVICLVAMLLLLYKTIIYASLFSLFFAWWCFSFEISSIKKFRTLLVNSVVVGALMFGLLMILTLLDVYQPEFVIERFVSNSSFFTRIEVFGSALYLWISDPLRLIFGFGPSFLDNAGAFDLAINFKTSAITGDVEGTVDSGWLSYAIELGVIGVVCLFLIFRRGLGFTYNLVFKTNLESTDRFVSTFLVCSLLFLFIALSTQMLGYTKTAWFPFQILFWCLSARGLILDDAHQRVIPPKDHRSQK